MPFLHYIENGKHYDEVLSKIQSVKKDLWIGTADIKDVYIHQGLSVIPLLSVFEELIRHRVNIRLIHAKQPGPNFVNDYNKYPLLKSGMEQMLCPRVHFKIMIFDFNIAYVGSANLTGAGIGMKSSNRHNFEAGILTDIPELVKSISSQFDTVWYGGWCNQCGRKQFCKK